VRISPGRLRRTGGPPCPPVVFTLLLLISAVFAGCGGKESTVDKRMIILGIDGMDPKFLERHWADLPNLDKLRSQGDFKPLGTTIPPQSPVAWSSVITGLDPGGHGIFDFVHRDPFTRLPFSSMAETTGAGKTLDIGPYVLPLSSPEVRQHRAGTAFWPGLAERGIPTSVIRMPANFPPVESKARTLSGMGTPDMLGTYGTFTFVTDDPNEKSHDLPGGRILRIKTSGNTVKVPIEGPVNTFLKTQPHAPATDFERRDFHRAPEAVVSADGHGFLVFPRQDQHR